MSAMRRLFHGRHKPLLNPVWWRQNQDRAKIIDVGQGRACDHLIADRCKKAVRIVCGKCRGWIDAMDRCFGKRFWPDHRTCHLCGTINADGLQEKIAPVFEEIQRSNMSKLDSYGQPIYREDGKVMKSERYFKPDIASILR